MTYPDPSAMPAWSCDDCPPQVRACRGNCGGPMQRGHGIDADGTVPLYRVVPISQDEPWSDDRVASCPVAEVREWWVADVLNLATALRVDGITLRDVVAQPSAQCLEALRVVDSERAVMEARLKRPKGSTNGN